jgi:quercetin dioxygenase-like cupin family protein
MKLMLVVAVAATAAAQTSSAPIDNDQVKVVLAHQQPHVKTRLHEHTVNRVMVYLEAGKQTFDYQGNKSELTWKAGEPKWSPASGMHVAEIVSDKPVTIAEIELKKTGVKGTSASAPLDPVKVDPKHYHVEFENDQVRVLRVRIPPHQSTPIHTHVLNRVIVYLSDQDIQVTTTDGTSDRLHHKQGEVSWGGPASHKEENMSDHLFEVIAVEIKN